MSQHRRRRTWTIWPLAFLLAVFLLLIIAATSQARPLQAQLLRSDPADDAVLRVAPRQVRLWFSEALDRSSPLNTVVVVDAVNRGVDRGDTHVNPGDASELVVDLFDHLPPGDYTVAWNTVSAVDNRLASGTTHFTVTLPDGALPQTGQGVIPGEQTPDESFAPGAPFSLLSLMVGALLEVVAVCWVGAQFFLHLVLESATEEPSLLRKMEQRMRAYFERRFALPAVFLLLVTNSGVLFIRAIASANSQGGQLSDPSPWFTLLTSGPGGLTWLIRELLILLALRLTLIPLQMQRPPHALKPALSWLQLLVSLALVLTVALASPVAALPSSLVVFTLLAAFLQMLAAAFWIGGLLFLSSGSLPVLQAFSPRERAHALLALLSAFSPWAITGMGLLVMTTLVSTALRVPGWDLLGTMPAGQISQVQFFFLGLVLLLSGVHSFWLRPRLQAHLGTLEATPTESHSHEHAQSGKRAEEQVVRETRWLLRLLWWEAGIGLAVLLCIGALHVLGGSALPA